MRHPNGQCCPQFVPSLVPSDLPVRALSQAGHRRPTSDLMDCEMIRSKRFLFDDKVVLAFEPLTNGGFDNPLPRVGFKLL